MDRRSVVGEGDCRSGFCGHLSVGHTGRGAYLRESTRVLSAAGLVLLAIAALAQADYDRMVPVKYCGGSFDTSQCFSLESGKTYQVGNEFSYLDSLYRLCLEVDTNNQGIKPVRVMLVVDKSSSMCRDIQYPAADRNNNRITAAHRFVDSLHSRSPESEVGVITFWGGPAARLAPLRLESSQNRTTIHGTIDDAACDFDQPGGKKAVMDPGCTGGTCPGGSLSGAIEYLDAGFDTAGTIFDRHVILITDGEWNGTPTAQDLVSSYQTTFPGRQLPTVHGIFVFPTPDSAFPLDQIQYLSGLTGGQFTRLLDPSQLTATFLQLLQTMTKLIPRTLLRVSVTNLADISTHQASQITPIAGSGNDFIARLPSIPLAVGTNRFVVSRIEGPGTPDTVRDTLVIERLVESKPTADIGKFILTCRRDTVGLALSSSPPLAYPDQWVACSSAIDPAHDSHFKPQNVQVRAFVRFPANATGTAALYRMDGTVRDEMGSNHGTGTVKFTAGVFDSALAPGQSFSVQLPDLSGDFTIEAWIKPSIGGAAAYIISSADLQLRIDANGMPAFESRSAGTIRSGAKLDNNVWQHVAVARTGGMLHLFVNGIEVAQPVASSGGLSGTVSIGPAGSGILDEVRISKNVRLAPQGGVVLLDIPLAAEPLWRLSGNESGSATLAVPFSAWLPNTKRMGFQVTDRAYEDIIVNLLHLNTADTLIWSKNADPVRFANPDTLGPEVKRVLFYLGNPPGRKEPIVDKDTLVVMFSEPVEWKDFAGTIPRSVFNYIDAGTENDEILNGASIAGAQGDSGLVILVNVRRVVPLRDSIRFKDVEPPLLTDRAGNQPRSVRNTMIEWGRPYDVVTLVGPVPFHPGVDPLPTVVRDNVVSLSGTPAPVSAAAVQVISARAVDQSKTTLRIYDAVGNVVHDNFEYFREKDGYNGYFFWDGHNRAGRRVGAGTYKCIAKVRFEDGSTNVFSVKIGVAYRE